MFLIGIVTRFDLYTRPVRNLWITAQAFGASELPAVLAAFTQWQNEGAQTDPKTSVLINILPTSLTIALTYSQNSAVFPEAFAPFENLENGMVLFPPGSCVSNIVSDFYLSRTE